MTRAQHVALKGTREGLVLYLDPEIEFDRLKQELDGYLRETGQFFQGAAVRCYSGGKDYSEKQREVLSEILKEHKLQLRDWLKSDEVNVPVKISEENTPEKDVRFWDEGMVEGKSLFMERTLRSGKSVQYDGHVIILGDVNPGAEIIASGNIIVLGALRGVAHAGATGDRSALVCAYHLAPTQLRIADLVTRAPKDEEIWRGPEIAKVKGEQLIVEGMVINGLRGKTR